MERPLVFSALRANSRATVDDVIARHAGDVFGPGRRVRLVVVIVRGDVARRPSRGRGRNWRKADRTPSSTSVSPSFSATRCAPAHCASSTLGMIGGGESRWSRCRRNRERRLGCSSRGRSASVSRSFVSAPRCVLLFQIPFAFLAPAEADGTVRHDRLPLARQRATVFHSGLLASPSVSAKSAARSSRSGT